MKKLSKNIMTIAACVALLGSTAVSISNSTSACGHSDPNYCNAADEYVCYSLSTKFSGLTSKRQKKNSTSVYFDLVSRENQVRIINISVYGAAGKYGEYKNRTLDNYGRRCDYVTILPAAESATQFQIYNDVFESNWSNNPYCELRGKTNYVNKSAIISFNWSPDTCKYWGTPSTIAHS